MPHPKEWWQQTSTSPQLCTLTKTNKLLLTSIHGRERGERHALTEPRHRCRPRYKNLPGLLSKRGFAPSLYRTSAPQKTVRGPITSAQLRLNACKTQQEQLWKARRLAWWDAAQRCARLTQQHGSDMADTSVLTPDLQTKPRQSTDSHDRTKTCKVLIHMAEQRFAKHWFKWQNKDLQSTDSHGRTKICKALIQMTEQRQQSTDSHDRTKTAKHQFTWQNKDSKTQIHMIEQRQQSTDSHDRTKTVKHCESDRTKTCKALIHRTELQSADSQDRTGTAKHWFIIIWQNKDWKALIHMMEQRLQSTESHDRTKTANKMLIHMTEQRLQNANSLDGTKTAKHWSTWQNKDLQSTDSHDNPFFFFSATV